MLGPSGRYQELFAWHSVWRNNTEGNRRTSPPLIEPESTAAIHRWTPMVIAPYSAKWCHQPLRRRHRRKSCPKLHEDDTWCRCSSCSRCCRHNGGWCHIPLRRRHRRKSCPRLHEQTIRGLGPSSETNCCHRSAKWRHSLPPQEHQRKRCPRLHKEDGWCRRSSCSTR
jgi:hypothetical protein